MSKAKESAHIKKIREKVKTHIQEENKKITPKALSAMTKSIQHWLQRHSGERTTLKSKNIETFDENRHPAKISSHYILHLQKMLKHDLGKKQKSTSLRGRIKSAH